MGLGTRGGLRAEAMAGRVFGLASPSSSQAWPGSRETGSSGISSLLSAPELPPLPVLGGGWAWAGPGILGESQPLWSSPEVREQGSYAGVEEEATGVDRAPGGEICFSKDQEVRKAW